jgi:hypothetical protein
VNVTDRLIGAADLYYKEAQRCFRGRAYLAAVVMQVSVLEGALQALCTMYPNEVKTTSIYKRKKFRRKRSQALELSLHQLIDIAAELSWFPAKRIIWAGKKANLAGFTHEIRKVRNYVHPAVWARERGEPKADRSLVLPGRTRADRERRPMRCARSFLARDPARRSHPRRPDHLRRCGIRLVFGRALNLMPIESQTNRVVMLLRVKF